MFMTCNKCGKKFESSNIKEGGCGKLKCKCGNTDTYIKLPLFVLTGSSGAGKSTVGRYIQKYYNEVVVMECDLLWNNYFNSPESKYKEFREMWLRVCKNINQIGKSVLLVGCGVPEQYEDCEQRKFFEKIHYIALVSSDKSIEKRLLERPDYRNCSNKEYINEHLQFNNWIKKNANKTKPKMYLINNEFLSIEDTSFKVIDKIKNLN
ncbi:MAG: shikimate kinase [Clostridiales bacterium]